MKNTILFSARLLNCRADGPRLVAEIAARTAQATSRLPNTLFPVDGSLYASKNSLAGDFWAAWECAKEFGAFLIYVIKNFSSSMAAIPNIFGSNRLLEQYPPPVSSTNPGAPPPLNYVDTKQIKKFRESIIQETCVGGTRYPREHRAARERFLKLLKQVSCSYRPFLDRNDGAVIGMLQSQGVQCATSDRDLRQLHPIARASRSVLSAFALGKITFECDTPNTILYLYPATREIATFNNIVNQQNLLGFISLHCYTPLLTAHDPTQNFKGLLNVYILQFADLTVFSNYCACIVIDVFKIDPDLQGLLQLASDKMDARCIYRIMRRFGIIKFFLCLPIMEGEGGLLCDGGFWCKDGCINYKPDHTATVMHDGTDMSWIKPGHYTPDFLDLLYCNAGHLVHGGTLSWVEQYELYGKMLLEFNIVENFFPTQELVFPPQFELVTYSVFGTPVPTALVQSYPRTFAVVANWSTRLFKGFCRPVIIDNLLKKEIIRVLGVTQSQGPTSYRNATIRSSHVTSYMPYYSDLRSFSSRFNYIVHDTVNYAIYENNSISDDSFNLMFGHTDWAYWAKIFGWVFVFSFVQYKCARFGIQLGHRLRSLFEFNYSGAISNFLTSSFKLVQGVFSRPMITSSVSLSPGSFTSNWLSAVFLAPIIEEIIKEYTGIGLPVLEYLANLSQGYNTLFAYLMHLYTLYGNSWQPFPYWTRVLIHFLWNAGIGIQMLLLGRDNCLPIPVGDSCFRFLFNPSFINTGFVSAVLWLKSYLCSLFSHRSFSNVNCTQSIISILESPQPSIPIVYDMPFCPKFGTTFIFTSDAPIIKEFANAELELDDCFPDGDLFNTRPSIGFYPIILFSVNAYVPSNSLQNYRAIVYNRLGAAVPLPTDDQASNWDAMDLSIFDKWANIVEAVDPPPYDSLVLEFVNHFRQGRKVKEYQRAYDSFKERGFALSNKAITKTRIFIKRDELVLRYSEPVVDWSPRIIMDVDKDIQLRIGPYCLHYANVLKYNPLVDDKHKIKMYYAAGISIELLNTYVSNLFYEPQYKHVFAAGDDCLVIYYDGYRWTCYEGDASKFDSTVSTGPLSFQLDFMKNCGLDPFDAKILQISFTNKLVCKIKKDDTYYSLSVCRCQRPLRNTGGPDTSFGNTLCMLAGWYNALTNVNGFGSLASYFEEVIGFRMKLKCIPFEDSTFLKGHFVNTHDAWFWTPLPSRLLKLGKSLKDPKVLYRSFTQDRHVANLMFMHDLCYGIQQLPLDPILRAWVNRWLLKRPSFYITPEYDWGYALEDVTVYKCDLSWFTNDSFIHFLENRYSLTASDIETFIDSFKSIVPGDVFASPVITRFMQVDYA